jgi:mono/diheme cytochrome c family protein
MKMHRPVALIALLVAGSMSYGQNAPVPAGAAENWELHCAKCHGPDGKGQTKMGQRLKIRDLTDPKVQATFDDKKAFNAMKVGVTDENGRQTMKPIEDLTEPEMEALVAFIRSLVKK